MGESLESNVDFWPRLTLTPTLKRWASGILSIVSTTLATASGLLPYLCPGTVLMKFDPDPSGIWLVGERPSEVLEATELSEVKPLICEAERRALAGSTLVGYLSYDSGAAFDKAIRSRRADSHPPLAWFAVYDSLRMAAPPPFGVSEEAPNQWQSDLSSEQYFEAFHKIRAYIEAGDVYQVNLTSRLRSASCVSPEQLFLKMLRAQPESYAGLICTENFTVCSVSPELFLEVRDDHLKSKPMKGTARRGRTTAEDLIQQSNLARSGKERAENLMIVDMVRNDFGRIAIPGTVQTSEMFSIHKLPTVFQMTSTVTARTDATLCGILSATFPPASVTGAPKIRATEVIDEVERSHRGIYTGCIGVIGPGRNATFSVAIRTAIVSRSGVAEFGVGGGITWDSDPTCELEECHAKALVLTRPKHDFSLLETIAWSRAGGFHLLDLHLERMADSAHYFDFLVNRNDLICALETAALEFKHDEMRVRLLADRDGRASIEAKELVRLKQPLTVALSSQPVDTSDPFLFHKTTQRSVYDAALASAPTADDVILFNERGHVTEATKANLVARFGDSLVTPPVEDGLLNGTMRRHLLSSGQVAEASLRIEDLERADKLFLVNSVQGWIEIELQG